MLLGCRNAALLLPAKYTVDLLLTVVERAHLEWEFHPRSLSRKLIAQDSSQNQVPCVID
ncbi:hypothetical protein SMG44B_60144 [Stenotrophomonas maltophilia]